MITLEAQIALVADEAESQLTGDGADLISARPSTGRPPWRRPLLVAAAIVMVAAAVVVLPSLVRDDGAAPSSSPLPPTGAPPLEPNEPTVTADPDAQWLFPDRLPDGLDFASAVDFGEVLGATFRTVEFDSRFSDARVVIETNPPPTSSGDTVLEDVSVNGTTWALERVESADPPTWIRVRLDDAVAVFDPTIQSVVVNATGLDESIVLEVVERLELVAATDLPRPPLGLNADGAVVVAEATQDGVPKRLEAHTDGVNFAMSISGGGSSPVKLGDHYLVVAGAQGPNPNLVGGGRLAESLIYGLVHPDVATIEVELVDGSSVVSEPQDRFGFSEDFLLIAVPTATDGGLEQLAAVVAKDADGTELARDTGLAE